MNEPREVKVAVPTRKEKGRSGKAFCRMFHRKYHEVGTSEAADISMTRQIWQCQWWCRKCGNHWRVWTTVEMLEEPKWEPSVEGFIELGRQSKEANRIERLEKENVDAK